MQLTSVTSILHRFSGIALAAGLLLLVFWIATVAAGPAAFAAMQAFLGSFLGRTLLFLWTAAFFYHLLNGIRHLAWDCGWGFSLPAVYRSGWAVVGGTAVLTLAAWVLGYYRMGAFS